MKSPIPFSTGNLNPNQVGSNRSSAADASQSCGRSTPSRPSSPSATFPTTVRDLPNPVDYQHPYESMARFADLLAVGDDANRPRHSYDRQVRLIHDHCGCDPADITDAPGR